MKVDFLKKLTHLKLEDKSIAKIQALEACEKVRVLYLFDNCIRRIENLGFARSLTHLYLQNNQITKIEGLETLGNLTKLCVPRPMLTLPVVALSLCPAARARSRGCSLICFRAQAPRWQRHQLRGGAGCAPPCAPRPPPSLTLRAHARAKPPGCAQGSRS